MAEPAPDDGPFVGYWRRLIGLDATVDDATAATAVERLAPWFGHTLARSPVVDTIPEHPSEAEEAAFRRLALARQVQTLDRLRAAGRTALPIKGFAAARLYDPPWIRILGDLDLLVLPDDVAATTATLAAGGFVPELSPQGALGVTSDVSFHPLVSPDGLVSVDLHTALDAFPLSAALSADEVFAAADGGTRPAPHHLIVAALSNLAKERFGPYALRHLVDLSRCALRETVDWPAVDRVVRAAGLGPARATALGALRRLGFPADRLPSDIDPGFRPAGRLAHALGHLQLSVPGRLAKVGREIGWCYAPGMLLRLWRFRIAGLLRPRSGLPPGAGTGS